MTNKPTTICLALVATVALTGVHGCSKKAVQSAGDQSTLQGAQQGAMQGDAPGGGFGGSGLSGTSEGGKSGIGSFPDTTMQSANSGGLKGLDKNPSEERVPAEERNPGSVGGGMNGAASGGGTLLAKADPGSTGRQMEEIRAEQAASAAAGLRDVFFAYDSWTISEEGRQALARDAEWIKAHPGELIKVEGHCDERGTSAYNLVLGEKRAKAVRNYLVELGVGANRLSVVSYGKERPFCNEHAESCYQQNRRGHLVVRSTK
ncbi:MAG TPA: peptidoglycan-associated lipoprotein Pal [Nitrospira sp.]|nr:peptidoglycan-associated lipoprotein Pal [Nitrospira sp.]